MAVNGTALALCTAGGIMIWSGLAGVTPLELTKSMASGQPAPAIKVGSPMGVLGKLLGDAVVGIGKAIGGAIGDAASALNPFASYDGQGGAVVPAVDTATGPLGARIAGAAAKYIGVPYKWGGETPAGWDCSGMVTWVLHHDLGLSLPDNTHTVTTSFLTWSGAETIPRDQCQAGDLICWITHIAIATGPDSGIGAQNPRQGTISGSIRNLGPGTGETYVIRRVKAQQTPKVV